MAWRYRRSIRLLPGMKVNLSKSGMSLSVGGPGATMNFGKRGIRTTVGIPGTGISYVTQKSSQRRQPKPTGVPPAAGMGKWAIWATLVLAALALLSRL